MKTSNIIFLFLSISICLYLKDLNLEGVDTAYLKAYNISTDLTTFKTFVSSQGYSSFPLWLYYVFSNFIGITYENAHFLLSTIYIFFSIKLPFLLKEKFPKSLSYIFIICYSLFFIFGQFGIALILSAEKMLLAMIFVQQAMRYGYKGNNFFKILFYFLSILTHFSLLIFIFLIEFTTIIALTKNGFKKILLLKLNRSHIYLLSIIIIPFLISFQKIVNKILRLIIEKNGEVAFENSYILLLVCCVIIFFILQEKKAIIIKLLGSSIFSLPVLIGIGTGRIAWLYSFVCLNYLFINPFFLKKSKKIIYFSFLIPLTLYYIYKSYVRIKLGVLQI